MRNYEIMLLVNPTAASKEWNQVTEEFSKTCEKHGAKVLLFNKWGKRKLAYPIKKMTRGTYALGFFETDGEEVPKNIKAEFMLSERVMRTIITLHEGEVKEHIMPPEETRRFWEGQLP